MDHRTTKFMKVTVVAGAAMSMAFLALSASSSIQFSTVGNAKSMQIAPFVQLAEIRPTAQFVPTQALQIQMDSTVSRTPVLIQATTQVKSNALIFFFLKPLFPFQITSTLCVAVLGALAIAVYAARSMMKQEKAALLQPMPAFGSIAMAATTGVPIFKVF
jgi:hypothetical protein